MEQFLKPQFLIPLLIGLAGIIIFYFWDKRKHKGSKIGKAEKDGGIKYNPIKAIIYDRTTTPFSWYETILEPEIVKVIVETHNIGRQLNYMGKKLFRYFKMVDASGIISYEGVRDPSDLKNTPVSAYIDNQHPYVEILDDMKEEKNFAQKYGHLLLWAGVIAFLIVVIITNKK
jgi:hypothetical protein